MLPTLAQDWNWSTELPLPHCHPPRHGLTGHWSHVPAQTTTSAPLQLQHRRLGLIMWEREAGDRWGEVTINPGTDAAAAGWFVSSLIKTTQTVITRQTPGWGGDTTQPSGGCSSRVMFDSWTQISNVRQFMTVFLLTAAAGETAVARQSRDSCLHPRYPSLELLC